MLFAMLFAFFPGEGPVDYGQPFHQESKTLTIEALMANPEAYLGQMVRVEGEVKEVCPKKGCWLDVVDQGAQVRVKVKDGEIVFDQKLVGKKVVAEGTVYKFELTKEQAVGYFRHLAEEKGQEFDPASVTAGTTIYQLGGLGVKVKR